MPTGGLTAREAAAVRAAASRVAGLVETRWVLGPVLGPVVEVPAGVPAGAGAARPGGRSPRPAP
ncbi:hypothetical protein SSP531S_01790 [Streptomyces spongiicola]|uniref:Uncharacterized protein n=1 Tax=Streptomyces spongiicola TaxID=1690221 RepID=A0A388SQC3_9ACTN|nr:hypothetical protein SSP531S_01790 [Streptomyces spongiicola]